MSKKPSVPPAAAPEPKPDPGLAPTVALVTDAPPIGELPPLNEPMTEEPQQPGEPKRRRRRRKAEPEAAAPVVDPNELAQLQQSSRAFFAVGSWLLARARGPHWAMSEEEVQKLGDAWAQALIGWLPAWLRTASPLLAALTVTVGVAWPRVQIDVEAAEKRAANPEGAVITAEVVEEKKP